MIIAPGVENPSVANMIELGRVNGKRRVDIILQDNSGNLIDIDKDLAPDGDPKGVLDLEITDLNNVPVYTESYWPIDPLITEPRLKRQALGKYYIDFGTEDNEVSRARALLFNWHARQDDSTEDLYRVQVLDIVSPLTLSILPTLRLMLDKTIKPVLMEKMCAVGYTDGMLIAYLRAGLHMINQYQPYPVWNSIDEYPIQTHSDMLIKAAMYQGVSSQLLFSIDNDIPQFSDQGHSFPLQHAAPLASYLSHLKAELDNIIPKCKLQFVNSGTISVEMRFCAAYSMLLSTSPTGALYRNYWST